MLAFFAGSGGPYLKADGPRPPSAPPSTLDPGPEMARLLKAFGGKWSVRESFVVSATRQGLAREGVASFKAGPGFSLIEEYQSNGSAGALRFLGVIWWEPSSRVYRLFTCANNGGCQVRGAAVWEGNTLVNTWEEELGGKRVAFKDSFVEISPTAFTLESEGVVGGAVIWHVTTRYTRRASVH